MSKLIKMPIWRYINQKLRGNRALKPEERLSIDVANYLREMSLKDTRMIWLHIANERQYGRGHKGFINAEILKAMGMVTGAPDYLMLWENGGLAVELKAGKGQLSESQEAFAGWCEWAGVPYVVCRSVDEVKAALQGAWMMRGIVKHDRLFQTDAIK